MIHFYGKYNGVDSTLPRGTRYSTDSPYKEIKDEKTLAKYLQLAQIPVMIILLPIWIWRFMDIPHYSRIMWETALISVFLQMLVLLPHEYLHGLCFKKDCWVFTNLSKGMLFVTGPEAMSKKRFIFMSLLPNLILGLLPFCIGLALPHSSSTASFIAALVTMFGLVNLCSGVGDYYNIWNTIRQVPKDGMVYMYGLESYWYSPKDRKQVNSVLINMERGPLKESPKKTETPKTGSQDSEQKAE